MISLSWFSSFIPKVRASGMKYYRIRVQLKRLVNNERKMNPIIYTVRNGAVD